MRNSVEQTVYHATSRSIDAEMRSSATRRTRQESELRAQLQRLQLEQRLHSEFDNINTGVAESHTRRLKRLGGDRKLQFCNRQLPISDRKKYGCSNVKFYP